MSEASTEESKAPMNGAEKEETSAEQTEQASASEGAENADSTTVDPDTGEKESTEDYKDQYLRLYAEFENYRKRTSKERIELFSSANQELMSALLPVVDDFDRAFGQMSEEEQASNHIKGIQLIRAKFRRTLNDKGLKSMEIEAGEGFDVDRMEAITKIPAPSEELKGKVVDVIEQGYKLGEKIIRYAKVVVGE
jgi:molecular chaperone GrpE